MGLFLSIFLLLCILAVFMFYKTQSSIMLSGLDQFIEGKFFNVLPTQPGPFKLIAEKINLIVHDLFIEKEKVEELLQEQQLLRYEFTEFFLQAHSIYDPEKIYALAVDTLYKMFHPEVVCFIVNKPGLLSDIYVRQTKEKSMPTMIVKENIQIEENETFFKPFLSNVPCNKDCRVFVPEIVGKVHSYLQIPISIEKEFIGILQLFNRSGGFDNNDKELVHTMAVFIANQLKVTQTLQDEKGAIEKYGSIINILNDGIIIFDENKNIIMENPAARDFFSLNQTKKNILINDLLTNRKFATINLVLFKPERLVLNGKIDELPELSNGSKTYILILRNITESKRKERERSELFFLTATAMHNELNTLLKKVKNNSEQISANALKAINFSFSLLNKLIYHAEMESGPLRLFKKPVEVSELITKVLAKREPELKERKIKVSTKVVKSEHRVFLDSDTIELSINLLFDFFLKTNKCNHIAIESHFDEDRFVARFLQVGHFYNTMELYEITKPNLQVERFMESDQEIGDLNLELSYVKHILASHGGEFVISNEHDGTRFSFIIPF